MGELGERLRRAREQKGLSLGEVERGTKIRRRILEALEREDFAALPGTAYVQGFVKIYAEYLGLDSQELLALLPKPAPEGSLEPAVRLPKPRMGAGFFVLAASILLLAGVTFAYFYFQASISQPPPSTPAAVVPTAILSPPPTPTAPVTPPATSLPPPSPSAKASPTATPDPYLGKAEVRVRIVGRSWLSVEVDGKKAYADILEVGEQRTWTGRELVAMRVGNAGGVEVTYNGKYQGLLGRPGEVADVEWLAKGVTPRPTATPMAKPTATPAGQPKATASPTVGASPTAAGATATATP